MTRRGRRLPALAIIGAGRLARALVPLLSAAKWPVVAVAARSANDARRLCRAAPGACPTTDLTRAVRDARVVLIAVPDREIAGIAARLVRARPAGWRGSVVLHHAGALGVEPLRPLARAGAATGVLHPLQCMGSSRITAAVLPGSAARVEGAPPALAMARRLARSLGLRPLALRIPTTPSDRSAYHAAASLVANDLVALLRISSGLLEETGMRRRDAVAALASLARGVLAHAQSEGIEGALTGPVVRGDAATVTRQIRRIRIASADAAEAHRLLSRELLRFSRAAGRVTTDAAREMAAVLRPRRRRPPGPSGGHGV